jgi:undecaprenyl diphosphate synthase
LVRVEKVPDEKLQNELKKSGEIPVHIAIIMDGNGRWARKRGFPRVAGHKRGIDTVKDIVKACVQIGVKYLTLYTFSTENWNRPKDEVSTLMSLLVRTLRKEVNELNENDVKLNAIGNVEALPLEVQKELHDSIQKTQNNTKMTLNLALSYSGRWELIKAIKEISQKIADGNLKINEISEECISNYLDTKNIPDPDLLIRTSGEFRVSNFLLWQIAYTEFFISEVYWPDFKRKDLYQAIKNFQGRERRFGKVSEQIQKNKKGLKNVSDLSQETI